MLLQGIGLYEFVEAVKIAGKGLSGFWLVINEVSG
jgi:hypothetical protein